MLVQIMEICVIPLLGILTKYLIDYLNAKRKEINANTDNAIVKKYIDMVNDTVTKCVIATNQTFVLSLKQSGTFDEKAQREAFDKTMNAVLAVLNADARKYISEITGDLNTYLTQLIEAEVNKQRVKTTAFVA